VAELVATVTDDERIIAAALLHDTLEDTNTSYGELITLFGVAVATLVYQVTNASMLCPDADRVTKAAIDRDFLSLACPAAKTIKLADVIDNTKSIRAYDPAFAKVYIAEKRALLGVLKAGDPTLWKMAHANVHKEG
jgi:(p)ppGpp synthase/HD superfamily hydrolase